MVGPTETTGVKHEEGEERKNVPKFNKRKIAENTMQLNTLTEICQTTRWSKTLCGQDWTGPVSESYGETATVCIDNIQE